MIYLVFIKQVRYLTRNKTIRISHKLQVLNNLQQGKFVFLSYLNNFLQSFGSRTALQRISNAIDFLSSVYLTPGLPLLFNFVLYCSMLYVILCLPDHSFPYGFDAKVCRPILWSDLLRICWIQPCFFYSLIYWICPHPYQSFPFEFLFGQC